MLTPCSHPVGGSSSLQTELVSSVHKDMAYKYVQANVGPLKVYHLLKEQVDEYESIGCTQKDLQNYYRDLKTLIKDTDA